MVYDYIPIALTKRHRFVWSSTPQPAGCKPIALTTIGALASGCGVRFPATRAFPLQLQ